MAERLEIISPRTHKLTLFVTVTEEMIGFGPQWLEEYIRFSVLESAANALGVAPESLRPKGEWRDAENGDGIVCPNCGADMRGKYE